MALQIDPENSPGRTRTADPPMGKGDSELAVLAKALGHPARVAILRLLLECGECVCGGLVEQLPLAQATVSQHLKVLKEAGLVKGEIDGPRVCYCAEPRQLDRMKTLLNELGTHARERSKGEQP